MLTVEIDYSKCNKCGKCITICCNSHVMEINMNGFPEYRNIHKCIKCGHCFAICPNKAIKVFDFSKEKEKCYLTQPKLIEKQYYDPIQIQQLLESNRSTRFFTEKEIEKDIIDRIIEVMVSAPSAGNEQNRNFYIFPKRKDIIELEKDMQINHRKQNKMFSNPIIKDMYLSAMMKHAKFVYNELGKKFDLDIMKKELKNDLLNISKLSDDFFYKKTSAAIVVTSDTKKTGFHKDFYKADISTAITYGIIMATSLGIASCRMGLSEIIFNRDRKIKMKYHIPENERIDGIIAFGYSDLLWIQSPIRGPSKVIWK
jgi:ferredoxin